MTDETRCELEDIATTLTALAMRLTAVAEELGRAEPLIMWGGGGFQGEWSGGSAFAYTTGTWTVTDEAGVDLAEVLGDDRLKGDCRLTQEACENFVRAYLAAQADTLTAAEVASEQDVSAAGEDALRDEAQRECWLETKTSSSGVL